MSRLLSQLKSRWPEALFLSAWLVFLFMVPPQSRETSHKGRMVLAGLAVSLVGVEYWCRKRNIHEKAKRALTAAWLAASLFGVFNYYQFSAKQVTTVGDYADATYYYLNSKYFPELGYARIYEAMLVADQEGARRFSRVPQYRDLVDYRELHPRYYALGKADEIKARFSPERWEAFKADLDYITKRSIKGGFNYFFIDHGYNPPPTWTFVGGLLADIFPVQQMKWITSVDMLLIVGVMAVITRVCGLRALLVALVFFTCTYSGRWPMLGQAILRFDWLSALVLAVLGLRAGRWGWAGAGFAYAACIRIFPAIFMLPVGVSMLRQWVADRRVSPQHFRFMAGAALVVLVLNGGAFLRYGSEAYQESIDRLAMHGSPESFSSRRVGLGAVLLYRGEWTRREINRTGGIEAKRDQLWELEPYLRAAGLLTILLIAAFVWRTRESPHKHTWLSIFPMFCLTNPQVNYYNLRLLPTLYHSEEWRSPRDYLGLALLFAVELATQATHVARADRYTVMAVNSYALLAYLLVMAALLLREAFVAKGRQVSALETREAA